MMKTVDLFRADGTKPPGSRDGGWKAICQYAFAPAYGADKSLFYYGDWIKKPGVAIVSGNDGLLPVIVKREAAGDEAKIEYTPRFLAKKKRNDPWQT